MAWVCAECDEPETGKAKIDVACHHCGKPLCLAHRRTVFSEVFGESDGLVGDSAYHCPDCYRAHHMTADFAEQD